MPPPHRPRPVPPSPYHRWVIALWRWGVYCRRNEQRLRQHTRPYHAPFSEN